MKKLDDLTAQDLAQWAERQGFKPAAAATPETDSWLPDNLLSKSVENRINWERSEKDPDYLRSIIADGRLNAAKTARAERLKAEDQARGHDEAMKQAQERTKDLNAKFDADLAAKEDARQEVNLAFLNQERRRQGLKPFRGVNAEGKPVT